MITSLAVKNVYSRGARYLAMEKALGPEHPDVDPRLEDLCGGDRDGVLASGRT
jgi:hypothetical protein